MFKKIPVLALLFLSELLVTAPLVLTAATNSRNSFIAQPISNINASSNILVPDNYARIQWAIGNATKGDTISVKAGTYNENLIVNKSISLVGEGPDKTIIDGQGKATVIYVTAAKVSVSGFTIQNGATGIWFSKANNCTVRQNNIKNISYGVRLDDSRNSVFTENEIEDPKWFGIVFDKSGNSTLRNNRLFGTRYNLRVDGLSLDDFLNDIDTSNTVNGMPIYYLKNKRDMTIDTSVLPQIGYLAIVNSSSIRVRDLNLMYSGQGILFAFTNNSVITKVSATGNWNGVEVQYSFNVTVSDSKTSSNGDFGIKFGHSTDGTIIGNEAHKNGWAGIGVFTSSNFTVTKNVANNNIYGLDLVYSKNNLVTLNSANNTRDRYSIALYYSNSNLIYHNNLVNHLIFKDVNKLYKNNTWDNNSEGNYWATYSGEDRDEDGIGDTPYSLGEGNRDNYPLMGMFSAFQVAAQYSVTVISNSEISGFQFDEPNKRISFDAVGENNTRGFSRLRLPKALVGDSYTILINGKEPSTVKHLTISNGTYDFVYITYINSTAVNSVVPPLFWLVSISLAMITLVLVLVFFMKKSAKSKVVQTGQNTSSTKLNQGHSSCDIA